MKLHARFQRGIERIFFGGRSTKTSTYVAYAIGNTILMVVLFFFLLNTLAYNWTGQLYPLGSGFRLLLDGLDDAIPFIPEMVIFYRYFFYAMVVLTMLYFAFVDNSRGYALGWSLVIVNAIALVFYIVLPVSTYVWRQDLLAHPIIGNFWATQVYDIYSIDTPFNCFPSLHAAVSVLCFYTWYQYRRLRPSRAIKIVAVLTFVIAAGIILSTLFIKQHYIADEIAGIVLAWSVGRLLFGRLWQQLKSTASSREGKKQK
jgi:membrane-associated phospholipid phosphatase